MAGREIEKEKSPAISERTDIEDRQRANRGFSRRCVLRVEVKCDSTDVRPLDNAATGDLSFLAAPDFETPADFDGDNIYEVEVTADDGNGGTTVQAISATVTAVNDNDPVFTSSDTPTRATFSP